MKAGCSMSDSHKTVSAEQSSVRRRSGRAGAGVFDNYIKVQRHWRKIPSEALPRGQRRWRRSSGRCQQGALAEGGPTGRSRGKSERPRNRAGCVQIFERLAYPVFERTEGSRWKLLRSLLSMAKASWLQTGKTILNPYMGASMLHCGKIKS